MQKKLFTRLYYTECFNHSEDVTTKLIDCIVNRALDSSIAKESQQKEIDMLREESMNRQTYTVEQAFTRKPFRTLLNQDTNVFSFVKEAARPYSAKINTFKRQLPQQKNNRRSQYRYSRNSTIKSAKSIASNAGQERRKGRFERVSNDRFIILPDESEGQNFEEQQYIAMLRVKKAKEEAYEKQKFKFFKTMAESQEKNEKINKKFIQQMSNKNFYYTKSGQLMETSILPNPIKLLKKTITSKTQNTKRQPNLQQSKPETIIVEYRQKQNPFKKVNQPVLIDTSKKNLFYKSQNCKYKVLD